MICMCIDAIIDARPRREEPKEYFTVFNNGKACRCHLTAKDLRKGADGNYYALGEMKDGEATFMIKVMLCE